MGAEWYRTETMTERKLKKVILKGLMMFVNIRKFHNLGRQRIFTEH